MRIENPLPEPYTVDDYDFRFTSGETMSFTISKELGDSIDFDTSPLGVKMSFVEKPSPTDPDGKLPAEEITVMMAHVIWVAHRTRLVQPLTYEEKDEFKKTLHKMSKTVN